MAVMPAITPKPAEHLTIESLPQPVLAVRTQENLVTMGIRTARDMTADQRKQVRDLLTTHFDDEAGAYPLGWSDQHIAELSGVPRVVVEQMREAAYGPIKVPAELLQLRTECDELKQRLISLSKQTDETRAAGADLTAKVLSFSSRLEKMLSGKA